MDPFRGRRVALDQQAYLFGVLDVQLRFIGSALKS
jgi:hypothetical protein